jgi:hypothetical protein
MSIYTESRLKKTKKSRLWKKTNKTDTREIFVAEESEVHEKSFWRYGRLDQAYFYRRY